MEGKPKPRYPRIVKVGPAAGTLYRNKHGASKTGFIFTAVCGKWRVQKVDLAKAEAELRLHLSKVAAGEVAAAGMTKEDRDELTLLRKLAGENSTALAAMREWKAAQDVKAGLVGFTSITADQALADFIKQGTAAGKQHGRTYGTKLKGFAERFSGRELHTISAPELTAWLETYANHVTRNDYRKKAVGLFRWARRNEYLPTDKSLAIEQTIRAEEEGPKIGVTKPAAYAQLLMYLHDYHPHLLAAAVLAGFAGERGSEIEGKRHAPDKRQSWADIHLDFESSNESPHLRVSHAKRNTPARRKTPLGPAALAWLRLIPQDQRSGFVCDRFAMQRVRQIGKNAGLDLPENGFRHGYISYRVELERDKPRVATDAGTSVEKIDKHYRDLVKTADASEWFNLSPEHCRAAYESLKQATPAENGAVGGASKSPKKNRRRNGKYCGAQCDEVVKSPLSGH